jgi:hypothetical protein
VLKLAFFIQLLSDVTPSLRRIPHNRFYTIGQMDDDVIRHDTQNQDPSKFLSHNISCYVYDALFSKKRRIV